MVGSLFIPSDPTAPCSRLLDFHLVSASFHTLLIITVLHLVRCLRDARLERLIHWAHMHDE